MRIILLATAYFYGLLALPQQEVAHSISLQSLYGFQMPIMISVVGPDFTSDATFRPIVAGLALKVDRRWKNNVLIAQGNFYWSQHSIKHETHYPEGSSETHTIEYPFTWKGSLLPPKHYMTSQAFLGYGRMFTKSNFNFLAAVKGGITAQYETDATFHHHTRITLNDEYRYVNSSISYGVILMPTIALSSTFEWRLSDHCLLHFEMESSCSLDDFFFTRTSIFDGVQSINAWKSRPLWLIIGKLGFSYILL